MSSPHSKGKRGNGEMKLCLWMEFTYLEWLHLIICNYPVRKICLHLFVNMDPWIFILYSIIYFVAQIFLAFAIGSSRHLVSTSIWLFFFFITSLLSAIATYSRFILYFSCPSPRINYFFKKLLLFWLKWYLEIKVWMWCVLIASGASFLLRPLNK